MAGSGVKLSLGGLDEAISNLGKAAEDHNALLAAIGEALVAGTHERFEEKKGPDGQPWPASPYGKTGLLVDTARLKNSINWQSDGQNVYVGTNVIYAALQQFGGTVTPKKAKALAKVPLGAIVYNCRTIREKKSFVYAEYDGIAGYILVEYLEKAPQ